MGRDGFNVHLVAGREGAVNGLARKAVFDGDDGAAVRGRKVLGSLGVVPTVAHDARRALLDQRGGVQVVLEPFRHVLVLLLEED